MKNIHILPTDKPSKLQLNVNTKMLILFNNIQSNNESAHLITQNIYITSDEEIKEGDWFIFGVNESVLRMLEAACKANIKYNGAKKIMLTTDPQLIKFGVQAIDDEFLEWFVKNPSCEYVTVYDGLFGEDRIWKKYIIIPKKEPNIISNWLSKNRNPEIDKQVDDEAKKLQKQHLIDMMKQDEELGLYEQEIKLEDVFNDDKKENIKKFIDEINNSSQPNDKLKQAFEKYSEYLEDFENKDTYEHGFKDGAKCQQEISYSEEEVIAFGEFIFKHSLLTHTRGVKNLFEQFKKK